MYMECPLATKIKLRLKYLNDLYGDVTSESNTTENTSNKAKNDNQRHEEQA